MRSYLGQLALNSVFGYEFYPDGQDEPIPLDGDYDHIPVSVPMEVMIEGGKIVEWHRDFSKAGYRDKTRKHIALCLMTTESRKESLTQTAEKTRANMLNALRWSCPAFDTEIQIYPLVVENPHNYGLNGPWRKDNGSGIKDMMEGIFPDFRPVYYHVIGGGSVNGLSGISSVNGWNSATFNPANWTTAVHEQFHAYGLHHHSTATAEYGGGSWMGRSNVGWGITAPDYHYLGLIGPENIERIGTGSFYAHLVAPEVDDQGMAPGERKIVYFQADKDYALWVRENKVRVSTTPMSRPDYQGNSGRTRYVTELAQGDRWETLRVDYVGRGVASVSINGASKTEKPIVSIPDEVSPITAGHFHDPGKTHQGTQIYRDTLDDGTEQAVLDWFTWDNTGAMFLIAQGLIEDEIAHLTIYYTDNRELVEIGSGILYFRGDNFATFKYRLTLKDKWWPGPGILQLTRLTKPRDFNRWKTGEREGVGWQDVPPNPNLPSGAELVMYWYQDFDRRTYRPRWLYGENGILYEPFGGVANTKTESGIRRYGRYKIRTDEFLYRKDGWGDWQSNPLGRLI